MKPEQKVGITFTGIGFVTGIISNFLSGSSLAFAVPLIVYIAMLFSMEKIIGKKLKWIVTNSLLVFLLTWLIVWVFLFNIG